jgi:hypothetical protein
MRVSREGGAMYYVSKEIKGFLGLISVAEVSGRRSSNET